MSRDEDVLRANDGKIALFLSTHLASITELSSDVRSPGSYGYLHVGLPIFRGGSDTGQYTAPARALHLTGCFRKAPHHD